MQSVFRGMPKKDQELLLKSLEASREMLAEKRAKQQAVLEVFRSTFTRHKLADENLWRLSGFVSETLVCDNGVKVLLKYKDFKGVVASAGPIELPGKQDPVAEINAACIACLHVILGAFPL